MRISSSLALAALLSAAPASAQSAVPTVFASQADLDDGGTLTGALPTCLALAGTATTALQTPVLFFDRASRQVATYDPAAPVGARTTVVATAAALAAAAGSPVSGCSDAENRPGGGGAPSGTTYLAVTTESGVGRVLQLGPDDTLTRLTNPADASDAGDGVTALAYAEAFQLPPTLFVARSRADGAPDSGVYALDPDAADQAPTPVVMDPDLDLVALAFRGPGELLGVSSNLGTGPYRNVLVGIGLNQGGPYPSSVSAVSDPCGSVFAACPNALGDLALDSYFAGDFIDRYALVMNDAPGEAVGAVGRDASYGLVFVEGALVSNTPATGYATPGRGGYLAVVENVASRSTLLVAGSDEGSATPGIYAVLALAPVAGEAAPEPATGSVSVGPNPSVGTSMVRVSVSEATQSASVTVYDALGRHVAILHDGPLAVGTQSFSFDALGLPAGVYTIRVDGETIATTRLTVAR